MQIIPGAKHAAQAALFKQPVVGQLPARGCTRSFLRAEVDGRAARGIAARQNRRQRNTDSSAAHGGQGNGIASARLAGDAGFREANLRHRAFQIAIPAKCVPREVQMRVDDQNWIIVMQRSHVLPRPRSLPLRLRGDTRCDCAD